MKVQSSKFFATTTYDNITIGLNNLKTLGEKWTWQEDDLYYAGVGSPLAMVNNLKNGFFKPSVPERALLRQKRVVNISRKFKHEVLSALDNDEDNHFDELSLIGATSDFNIGEIPIEITEQFTGDILRTAEHRLSSLCKKLEFAWETRINADSSTQPLMTAAHRLLHAHTETSFQINDNIMPLISVRIERVLDQLPKRAKDVFIDKEENLRVGCFMWLKHCCSEKNRLQNSDETCHEMLYKTFCDNYNNDHNAMIFQDFLNI